MKKSLSFLCLLALLLPVFSGCTPDESAVTTSVVTDTETSGNAMETDTETKPYLITKLVLSSMREGVKDSHSCLIIWVTV